MICRPYTTPNGIEYFHINHDINGNPRYVVHYLPFGKTYDEAVKNFPGGSKYRARWFGGGIVFSTYNGSAGSTQLGNYIDSHAIR